MKEFSWQDYEQGTEPMPSPLWLEVRDSLLRRLIKDECLSGDAVLNIISAAGHADDRSQGFTVQDTMRGLE